MSESSKNIESSKLSGIYLKYRQRHLDEGHEIKTVLHSLIELTNNPDELQDISDSYTEQDFRVIEISKSVSNYIASPLKCLRADDE